MVLRGHQARAYQRDVLSAVFDPEGKRIVTAGFDGTARIWDAASGKSLDVLRGHEGAVTSAAFDLDGGGIVTSTGFSARLLWSTDIYGATSGTRRAGSGSPSCARTEALT